MAIETREEVNDFDFDARVLGVPGPVLVDFTAAWCPPCRALHPVLDRAAERHPNVRIVQVDVDEARDLTARFDVRGMPTLVLFQGGKEVARRIGLTNAAGLDALLAHARSDV